MLGVCRTLPSLSLVPFLPFSFGSGGNERDREREKSARVRWDVNLHRSWQLRWHWVWAACMAALRPLVANYARNTLKPPEQTKTTESESLVGVHIRSERERPDCVGAVCCQEKDLDDPATTPVPKRCAAFSLTYYYLLA